MPTGSGCGDDRVMQSPYGAGRHGLRPWRRDILSVRIAQEPYHEPRVTTRNYYYCVDMARGTC
eukprot:5714683-Prymnesium_polylepis.1